MKTTTFHLINLTEHDLRLPIPNCNPGERILFLRFRGFKINSGKIHPKHKITVLN